MNLNDSQSSNDGMNDWQEYGDRHSSYDYQESFQELSGTAILPVAETINLADHADIEPMPFGRCKQSWGTSDQSTNITDTMSNRQDIQTKTEDSIMQSLVNGETVLARELAKLSVSEREEVLHDIHGVTENVVLETPELISEKLSKMDEKIEQTRAANRSSNQNGASAYSIAKAMSSEYAQSSRLRLMFLRASHFDVEKAAQRFLGHFEKMELFGPDKLTETITINDLNADDMVCLTSGQSQLLPYRDRSGRAIFFQALSHYRCKEVVNAMRVIYYILMSAMEDEETQKRGIVYVVYNVEPKSPLANDPRIYLNVYQLLPQIPVLMMGAHYCVQDSYLRQFMSSIRVAMSREVRLRSRVHYGSHEECIYALLTFGIPTKSIPISNSGELLVEKHGEFLAMRLKQETQISIADFNGDSISNDRSPPVRIVVPKNADVLLGRGRPFQEHPGNMRCNFEVLAAMEEYERVSRKEKTVIARNVIAKIWRTFHQANRRSMGRSR
ncbi:hypothetical protein IV203_031288 [Nitzschia inconspicua]|uniref:DUF6824 domain-containing protein n=1 Tax=Nitzschia inconspicua TaxID=303405 RepID=A0A9K3Q303_9STRA|nr:hypothetical protein IV203_031288 [Nitzschia inconspicua]